MEEVEGSEDGGDVLPRTASGQGFPPNKTEEK